jgi:hypothetical protein
MNQYTHRPSTKVFYITVAFLIALIVFRNCENKGPAIDWETMHGFKNVFIR